MPSALEREREDALVAGASAGSAAWLDLAAIGDVAAQPADVFVVDVGHFVDAERAYFAARGIATTATTAWAAGSAGWPAIWPTGR